MASGENTWFIQTYQARFDAKQHFNGTMLYCNFGNEQQVIYRLFYSLLFCEQLNNTR